MFINKFTIDSWERSWIVIVGKTMQKKTNEVVILNDEDGTEKTQGGGSKKLNTVGLIRVLDKRSVRGSCGISLKWSDRKRAGKGRWSFARLVSRGKAMLSAPRPLWWQYRVAAQITARVILTWTNHLARDPIAILRVTFVFLARQCTSNLLFYFTFFFSFTIPLFFTPRVSRRFCAWPRR